MARGWHLGPVLRAVRGHRAAATLVVLQLAVGLAIAVVSVQLASYMRQLLTTAANGGVTDVTLVELQLPGAIAETPQAELERRRLLETVAATPGVMAVATAEQPPLRMAEQSADEVAVDEQAPLLMALEQEGGPGLATALGLTVLEGRDLGEADLGGPAAPALITRELAELLFPGEAAVGRRFLSRSHGEAVVVGVVAELNGAPMMGAMGRQSVIYGRVAPAGARLVVVARSQPGRAAEVRAALRERLPGDETHMVRVSAGDLLLRDVERSLVNGIGVVTMLVATMVLVVLIGSLALTYHLVASRTREIGLRRAVGASRGDVVRHFVVENAMLTGAGSLVGLGLFAAMVPMMIDNQVGFSVDWLLVTATVAVFWTLSYLATLLPARRAAAVTPSVATRTS